MHAIIKKRIILNSNNEVEEEVSMDEVNEISTVEVEGLMKANKQIAIIDVREAEEVTSGMISEAVHIPMGEIPHARSSVANNEHKKSDWQAVGRSGPIRR